MFDVIIVGAGPAGLTAAIYLKRASKKVLVLEANCYGGQIVNTLDIENYPGFEHISGFDFSTKLYNQALKLGAEVVFEKVENIKKDNIFYVETAKNKYKAQTVILATGLDNRKIGLGEDHLIGKGVSYCATCDGSFYKDKEVAVVGGGNTAVEDALYLSDVANKVYLIHRKDKFRADEITVNKLNEKKNVEFIYNSNITKIIADDKLTGIEINNDREIKIDGLFIAIGKIPGNNCFKSLITLDDNGYILTNENCKTNIPGLFAAGDNRSKEVRQLVTATGDGAIAANEVLKYINSK